MEQLLEHVDFLIDVAFTGQLSIKQALAFLQTLGLPRRLSGLVQNRFLLRKIGIYCALHLLIRTDGNRFLRFLL